MKILNLYSGIGGNRHLWGCKHEITAIEINPDISAIYKSKFPNDTVINTDAHYYLLDNYQDFDFIWSSPPCPSHSKLCYSQLVKRYIDFSLYQQIILLKSWFKGKYVIENVKPYYDYLIKPTVEIGRHLYWCNFRVNNLQVKNIDISRSTVEQLSEYLGIPIPKYKASLLLRNCVEPKIGKHFLDAALNIYKENKIEQIGLFK
jgi:DNA (cytosine-5)-methyltransferase 1